MRTPSLALARLGRGLVLSGASALLLVGCGKEPNLHEDHFLAFPNVLPEAPRPLASGSADPATASSSALATVGDRLLAVDRDNGSLVELSAQTLAPVRTVAFGTGTRPEAVVVDAGGAAWVTLRGTGEVVRVPSDAEVPDVRIHVGTEPMRPALVAGGSLLAVPLWGDAQVAFVSLDTASVAQRVDVGGRPRAVAVSGDRLVVVRQASEAVALTLSPEGFALPPQQALRLRRGTPSDGRFDPARTSRLSPTRAVAATIQPETGAVLVAHIQAQPGDAESAIDALLARRADDRDEPTPSTGGYGGGAGTSTLPLDFAPPSRPVEPLLSSFELHHPEATQHATPPVQDPETGLPMTATVADPSDVRHHPTHTLAFLVGEGSDTVLAFATQGDDPMRSPVAVFEVGEAPRAIAFSADGRRAFVLDGHGHSVSELDLAPLLDAEVVAQHEVTLEDLQRSEPGFFGFGGPMDMGMPVPAMDDEGAANFRMVDTGWGAMEPLRMEAVRAITFADDPAPEAVQRGRRVFMHAGNERLSHGGQFACATCHLEAGEDKLVWFIADGPRQTPSLAGRLLGTAPFNWNGTKEGVQGNMVQTVERMGGLGLTEQELADMEQFLLYGTLAPPNPSRRGADEALTAQEELGRELFHDSTVGCASCHAGPETTDGLRHDVGTLSETERTMQELAMEMGLSDRLEMSGGRLNTPSLQGLFYTAPYLHDGSAATLRDVLDRTATTMGRTDHLTDADKDALVAYLLTL